MEKEKKICPDCGHEMKYLPVGDCNLELRDCEVTNAWVCINCGKVIKKK